MATVGGYPVGDERNNLPLQGMKGAGARFLNKLLPPSDSSPGSIYGRKDFTEPFVVDDPSGGRKSNVINAIGTGIKNMFGVGNVQPDPALIANAEPVATPSTPAISAITAPASNGVGIGYRPDTKMDSSAAMKLANAGNVQQNADRTAGLSSSGFTMEKDAQGNEVWSNASQNSGADSYANTTIPAIAESPNQGISDQQRKVNEKLDLLRSEETQLAKPRAIGGKDLYNMSFVGDARMSNPSYRAAMLETQGIKMREDGRKTQLETVRGQIKNIGDIDINREKLAVDRQKGISEVDAKRYSDDQQLAGHKYIADQGLEARKVDAIGREAAALASAGANKQKQLSDQQKDQAKQNEADKKDIHDILTNGYGITPTPQAVKAYKNYQASLNSWDNETTKALTSYTKANPDQGAAIKSALIAYHRNPTDETAIKKVTEARALLTGNGNGNEPEWFAKALKMPTFETTGMLPWKQPQPIQGT